MKLIDIHSHFLPRTWPDLAARFGTPDWPWMRHMGAGKAMLMVGERDFRPVSAACWARAGHRVTGVDVNADKVEMLASGRSPILEPGFGVSHLFYVLKIKRQ